MRTRIGGGIRAKFVVVAIAVAAVVAFTLPAQAQSWNPKVSGKTYGEWGAAWWQWALAGPDGANAVQGTADCSVNQPSGSVWFLAGTFGVVAEEPRNCTVPKDRALFYPLVNSFWVDCPNSPDEDLTDAEVRAIMATYGGGGDNACQLTSTLDGVAISSKQIPTIRSQSPTFSATLPVGHVLVGSCNYDPPGGYGTDLPPGKTGRMISEGYWAMVPPLSRGEHTLTLHGANCDPVTGEVQFQIGVTYHLTVN